MNSVVVLTYGAAIFLMAGVILWMNVVIGRQTREIYALQQDARRVWTFLGRTRKLQEGEDQ